ncbi:hypothetical protein THRCLA_06527 [Thraustotheca clavata]|uniref:25S rRNA (uridine-N(3))-methyltransferase BMT5-like domain-containing protein n=1 Tax=Thraustotheca clavata TaxID=74557 RepID=A0A1V9ZN60_9STRA|nr:hypothetical protein THRCLA_06527 [Thraustotheca clavata]
MGKRRHNGASFDVRANKKLKLKQDNKASSEKLYTAKDVILVLGDGDFTFSKGLVEHRGSGINLIATSFDSSTAVRDKYKNAYTCINAIRQAKAHVLHDIDATKLDQLVHNDAVPALFDYIIFNFPHSGEQRVHINRVLLLDFFGSARSKLKFRGEVHISLKNKPPYSNWNVEDQAKASGFVLKERRPFRSKLFPGYNHRTTDPDAKKFEADQCTTYVFIVDRSRYPVPTEQPPKTPLVNTQPQDNSSKDKFNDTTKQHKPIPAKVEIPKPKKIESAKQSTPEEDLPMDVQRDIRLMILEKLNQLKYQ